MCPIKTDTISGILARTTRLRLSVAFVLCLAILYGLTRSHTRFFTFTLHRPGSRHTTKCVQQSGGIVRGSAHVAPNWPYPLAGRQRRNRNVSLPQEVSQMRAAVPCMLCGARVYLNAKNCTLRYFTRQPAFSWVEMHCSSCNNQALNGKPQEWFFHPTEWKEHLRAVIASEVSLKEEEWVDQKTYEEYLECWGKHLEVHELTQYQENQILFLRWLLNHYDTRFFDEPERGEL